jgi:ABC-2 type transport system ATP-binding protein
VITVTEIGKRYGDLIAVDRLNFEIKGGETFGLLGPNGAGKSTTIAMLVGLLKPDQGSVHIGEDGDIYSGAPTSANVRKRIGISPQSLSLYEELSARENLRFFGGLYSLSGKQLENRTDWALEFAGLTDRQHDRVGKFSGGMKRRLNIAVALIHRPDILLLDEPTVGVDPQSRNHIFESIEALKETGLTVIYTTHYMEEAQRLCDRVAIVDQGKLLALDTVSALIDQHGGQSVVTGQVDRADRLQNFQHELVEGLDCEDNQLRFYSTRPFEAVSAMTSSAGVQFQTLNLARPDLESVFLALTGRRLRD